MKFRAIDANEDWDFGSGLQSYFTAEKAIEADVKTALLTFLGEVWFALNFGVDWWNLLGAKNPAAQAGIILQCRAMILSRQGVTAVNSVTPLLVGRKLTVTYNINTIYQNNVTGSASPASP